MTYNYGFFLIVKGKLHQQKIAVQQHPEGTVLHELLAKQYNHIEVTYCIHTWNTKSKNLYVPRYSGTSLNGHSV